MIKIKKYLFISLFGTLCGLLNGLFGAGGGLVAVPVLNKLTKDSKKAHASAIGVILPVTIFSCISYYLKGYFEPRDGYIFILPGIIGAFVGAALLKKLPVNVINKIFSILMIIAGIRIIFK